MNTKIQELTDIIYNEGVAKGQAEAEQILAAAKEQSAKILSDARAEAEQILRQARKESADNADNVRKELGLYATQAVEALKSEIADVITDKIVADAVKGFTQDQALFNEFVLALAQEWVKKESIVISTEQAESLTKFFEARAKELLDGGVTINKVNGREAKFTIQPADGSYKVNFGNEEFENWFKSLLRPQLVQTLF